MTSCVVVGGGTCGLFSSIILADKFDKVYNKNLIFKKTGMKLKGIQNKRIKKYSKITKNKTRGQSIRRGRSKCRTVYTNSGNGNVPQYVCWD